MLWKRSGKTVAGGGVLKFPNPSRSYDQVDDGVRFWGYDQTFEIAFFVGNKVLAKLNSQTGTDEAASLESFDGELDLIREVAARVYSRRRKASYVYSYTLTESDFDFCA